MKKRVLSAILCSIMAASLLAGCGGGGESSAPAADGSSASTEEVKRTEDGYQIFDDVTLSYLYCWNGGFQPLENQYDNDVA